MNVIPFDPVHVTRMQMQKQQMAILSALTLHYLSGLKALGPAASAEVDGRIIACAGVAQCAPWMGTLWAFISEDAGPHFVRLFRCTQRLIEIPKLKRIEASTEATFPQGCRMLEMLKFKSEGLMAHYGPHGEDHIRYARIYG